MQNLLSELIFKTSRSGGSGGQNVNKVSTKVELNFHVASSQILTEEQKKLLFEKLSSKLTKEGNLQIISQAVTGKLEGVVSQYPEQYFWMHRRWKSRPAGDSSPVY